MSTTQTRPLLIRRDMSHCRHYRHRHLARQLTHMIMRHETTSHRPAPSLHDEVGTRVHISGRHLSYRSLLLTSFAFPSAQVSTQI